MPSLADLVHGWTPQLADVERTVKRSGSIAPGLDGGSGLASWAPTVLFGFIRALMDPDAEAKMRAEYGIVDDSVWQCDFNSGLLVFVPEPPTRADPERAPTHSSADATGYHPAPSATALGRRLMQLWATANKGSSVAAPSSRTRSRSRVAFRHAGRLPVFGARLPSPRRPPACLLPCRVRPLG